MTVQDDYPAMIPGEEKYWDWDAEFNCYGLFGTESGHCYRQSDEIPKDE